MDSEKTPKTPKKVSSPLLRQSLTAMVLLSAGIMLFLRPTLIRWVRKGDMPAEVLWIPAVIFFMFLLLYTWSRANHTGAENRKSAWLPFQVGFGLVLLLLVIPGQLREYRARKTPQPTTEIGMKALYKNKDARIRALVLNAAVCANIPPQQLHQIIKSGLNDSDPMVQEAATQAVEKLTGNQFERESLSSNVVQKSLDGFLEAAQTKGASEL